MQKQIIRLLALSLLALTNSFSHAQLSNPFSSKKTANEQRQDILKKSDDTLKALYQAQPKAKELIAKSVGYATFSNFGMKILLTFLPSVVFANAIVSFIFTKSTISFVISLLYSFSINESLTSGSVA